MKWVVLAIVVSLAGYTYVTLKYRKLNRPAQPVEDARERFVISRLRQAGYHRINVNAELPGDPASSLAGLHKPLDKDGAGEILHAGKVDNIVAGAL